MSGSSPTWYAVVDGSGTLISTGTVTAPKAQLDARGYTLITLPGDPTGQVWNSTSKTFSPAPPPNTVLPTWQWIQRFTALEFAGIKASADPMVQQFLLMIQTSPTITPQTQIIQQGLAYLVSLTLLTSDRATAIGAN